MGRKRTKFGYLDIEKEKRITISKQFPPSKTFSSFFFFFFNRRERIRAGGREKSLSASGFAGGAKVTEARNRGNTIKYDVDKENDDDDRPTDRADF